MFPAVAQSAANSCTSIQNFKQLVGCITTSIVNPGIALLIGVALVYFFIGVIQYMRKLGSKDQAEARHMLWWGIVALFVMVSVWGLVQILINSFGLDNSTLPTPGIPQFK